MCTCGGDACRFSEKTIQDTLEKYKLKVEAEAIKAQLEKEKEKEWLKLNHLRRYLNSPK